MVLSMDKDNVVEEAFKKAVEKHKKGNFEVASELYRAVLNVTPTHPDANHNLGLILEMTGKANLALQYFKNALEASADTELFWISFINSLIVNDHIGDAVKIIEQARQRSMAANKLKLLEEKILLKIDANSINQQEVEAAFTFWKKQNSLLGNIHLSVDDAECKKIPFREKKVWLRPTSSDVARVHEYLSNPYVRESYLHQGLVAEMPTTLVDIGANIGLASLSLVSAFPSVKKVIAVEADVQNFSVLEANFKLWAGEDPGIEWLALNAVATHDDDEKLLKTRGLYDLKPGHSASGTFRYIENGGEDYSEASYEKVVSMQSIVNEITLGEKIIVKIDIEGGEEHLFKSKVEWLQRCHYLTCEVHDRFHPEMINSSKNMIKSLVENNFAFVPSVDILHCYNRDKISCN